MASTFPIENGAGVQIHDIRYSAAKTQIEVFDPTDGQLRSSFSLSSYMGMHVDANNNLIVDDGVSRSNTYSTGDLNAATIRLQKVGSTYDFIGDIDTGMHFQISGSNGISLRSDDPKMYYRT